MSEFYQLRRIYIFSADSRLLIRPLLLASVRFSTVKQTMSALHPNDAGGGVSFSFWEFCRNTAFWRYDPKLREKSPCAQFAPPGTPLPVNLEPFTAHCEYGGFLRTGISITEKLSRRGHIREIRCTLSSLRLQDITIRSAVHSPYA